MVKEMNERLENMNSDSSLDKDLMNKGIPSEVVNEEIKNEQ